MLAMFRALAILAAAAWPVSAQSLTAVPSAPLRPQAPALRAADTVRLTLADARTLARRQNPDIIASRLDIEIARGNLRQARAVRSNPTVDILAPGASDSRLELGLSQEVEVWGQRGLRASSASSGLQAATLRTVDAERLLTLEVDRTYFRAFVAERRAALARELYTLNVRLSDVAKAQMREGEISKLDFNLAMVELGRSQARDFSALRESAEARLDLRRLLGLPAETIMALTADSTHRHASLDSLRTAFASGTQVVVAGRSIDQLVSRALERRPDLMAAGAEVQAAAADVSLTKREALPNPVPRIATEDLGIRPGIGFTLPILNRNRGATDAARAALQKRELERAATVQRIRTEVEAAARAAAAAAAEVEVLESTVLVPARENRVLLETAYREGKVGLPVLLLIRNQVIEAEQEYWTAWLTEREALAALAAATGEPFNPSGEASR